MGTSQQSQQVPGSSDQSAPRTGLADPIVQQASLQLCRALNIDPNAERVYFNPLFGGSTPQRSSPAAASARRQPVEQWKNMARLTRFERFSGEPDLVRRCTTEMSRFQEHYDHLFDYEGYMYALSFLSGHARECVYAQTAHLPSDQLSWALINPVLLNVYESPAEELSARQSILRVTQDECGSSAIYVTSFRRLSIKLRRTHDSDKQAYFRNGLTRRLKEALAPYQKFPLLNDLISFLVRMDAQLEATLPTSYPGRVQLSHGNLMALATAVDAMDTWCATALSRTIDRWALSPSEVRLPHSARARGHLFDMLLHPFLATGALLYATSVLGLLCTCDSL